jgi:hypothetical protein
MFLIQVLLPIVRPIQVPQTDALSRTRAELVERFGGATAYVQSPALGEWTGSEGERQQDRVMLVEIVAPEFDRSWWRGYARQLAARFHQQTIHVRALRIELLDPDAA